MANGTLKQNNRRDFIKQTATGGLAALSLTTLGGISAFADDPAGATATAIRPDLLVRSVPENMVYGYYGADVAPVAKAKDGDVVEIQCINTTGISARDPEAFFKANNYPLDTEHAQDVVNIMKNVKRQPGNPTGHMLTGPVEIEGAEVGDMLEIRVVDIIIRSEYGVNSVWKGGGGLPDAVTQGETFVYKYNSKKTIAACELIPGVEVPIRPFFGVMSLAPPPELGRVSSIPPYYYGGNFDIRYLTKGSTLYLPVCVKGGMFTTGDCHVAEGNGEVSGVSIEASLSLVAKFIVHKASPLKMARAETPTHFIAIGVDPDLRIAMKNAITEATGFIQSELGYTFNQAYSICSVAVDFEVSQVVNRTVGVHAMIPKSIFAGKKFKYWA